MPGMAPLASSRFPACSADPARSAGHDGHEGDGSSVVLERVPARVLPPPMYQVVMLNDDYTPMEFVVVLLQELFGKDQATATHIMHKIHFEGKGVCGVYSRDVATTKAMQALDAARQAGHPLQCIAEPAGSP